MNVEVNALAVVLAAVSTMAVGSLWYTPATFGTLWMKLTGVKPGKDKTSNGQMALLLGSTFVASLLTAYILAHVSYLSNQFFKHDFLQDTLLSAFWLWLGFTAARLYVHDAFESRPIKLTLLNAAHELVTILVMATIIGLMGVS